MRRARGFHCSSFCTNSSVQMRHSPRDFSVKKGQTLRRLAVLRNSEALCLHTCDAAFVQEVQTGPRYFLSHSPIWRFRPDSLRGPIFPGRVIASGRFPSLSVAERCGTVFNSLHTVDLMEAIHGSRQLPVTSPLTAPRFASLSAWPFRFLSCAAPLSAKD
jgi:hypothetical protein